MAAPAILCIDNKKYMSTKIAADLWGLKPKTVSAYCRNNRIVNKFKNSRYGWYIEIDEIKPLSKYEIHKLLTLSLQLKNNPSYEIDWSTFDFDDTAIETIYKNLVRQKYIKDFSIEDKKRIPYEVVLTEKGFTVATAYQKDKTVGFSSTLCQWLSIVINAAQLVCQAMQMKR